MFKYQLPNKCPKILSEENELENGDYGICYFRITRSSPPDPKDFIPQFYLPEFKKRRHKFKKENNFKKLCQMAGLSLLINEEDAKKMMKKFKKIGNYIYKGVLIEAHGVVLVTPSQTSPHHCSFYAYADVNEINIFTQKVS